MIWHYDWPDQITIVVTHHVRLLITSVFASTIFWVYISPTFELHILHSLKDMPASLANRSGGGHWKGMLW